MMTYSEAPEIYSHLKMPCAIDRFEGNYAVLTDEDQSETNILCSELPMSSKEGDLLFYDGECWQIDESATRARREELRSRLQTLFKK